LPPFDAVGNLGAIGSSTPTIAVSLPATSRSLIVGVVLHGAMPVEMVGRQVEQDAGRSG
jgi:hypothetical protein